MKGDLAGLEFRTGVFVDPHLVGYGDGAVFDGVSPVALSPGLEGDGAFEKADASGAAWRVGLMRQAPPSPAKRIWA